MEDCDAFEFAEKADMTYALVRHERRLKRFSVVPVKTKDMIDLDYSPQKPGYMLL